MQFIRGVRMKKGVTYSSVKQGGEVRFGRGLEAGLGFGSGGTEEGIPN